MNYPLCEVFGYPFNNVSRKAEEDRSQTLCPFHNKFPKCTKDKANNPLGVCSTFEYGNPIIICPVRFRQDWRILSDVSSFLVPGITDYKYVTEVRMKDGEGNEVGNVDAVLVDYKDGEVVDFGALEIQAVYISGNIRNPFEHYMANPFKAMNETWSGANPPRPDWLSSVKRLVRQLTVKGVILQAWKKKMAIAVQTHFYREHLPALKNIKIVSPDESDLCWYLYDLFLDKEKNEYNLMLVEQVYTKFIDALERFSTLQAGDINQFTNVIKERIRRHGGPAHPFE
ncbi:MAG: hypothetical protein IT308_06790 [Anaerolineaceae bacterium]|nr:hypothetical protein [Anaerolineaceae bacterium]